MNPDPAYLCLDCDDYFDSCRVEDDKNHFWYLFDFLMIMDRLKQFSKMNIINGRSEIEQYEERNSVWPELDTQLEICYS